MSALPNEPPLLPIPARPAGGELVRADALTACVRALDPGSRALLDLSLRRRLTLEAMAGVLRTDPFDLARRRARAVARIAAELDLDGPGVVACVRAALTQLPDSAWGLPAAPPEPPAEPVQAEQMKVSAQALMAKLRAQRELAVREAKSDPEPAAEDPLALGAAFSLPSPTSPFSSGFARIAEDEELAEAVAADVIESQSAPLPVPPVAAEEQLPSLADAMRRAAQSELAASVRSEEPVVVEAARAAAAEPVAEPASMTYVGRPRSRRLAGGGLLVALLAALLRFFFRR